MIGHNNPPVDPLDAHDASIRDIAELASGLTAIETQEQADAVDDILAQCKDAIKAADEARKAEQAPHNEAIKASQARWKPVIAIADSAKDVVQAILTPWKVKLADEAKACEDAARKAAEALQEAARAKLDSDDIADRVEAEIAFKAAGKAQAHANAIARSAKGLRTHWTAEVADPRAALNHYIKVQPDPFIELIQTLADRDARGSRPVVPGVVYHERKIAA
jgi:hypothetical protein